MSKSKAKYVCQCGYSTNSYGAWIWHQRMANCGFWKFIQEVF